MVGPSPDQFAAAVPNAIAMSEDESIRQKLKDFAMRNAWADRAAVVMEKLFPTA